MINSKALLYITGNYTQCPVINYNGKGLKKKKKKKNVYMRITKSLCCIADWYNIVNRQYIN